MATKIYDATTVNLIDGTEIFLTPLKIRYLREFMEKFEYVKAAKNDDEAIEKLVECTRVAMKQYHPVLATVEDVEDNFDIQTIYTILDISAGVKIKEDAPDTVKKQATDSGSTWDNFDLAKLEAEVFLLGIWKDYDELELSMSMPELTATLESKREGDYATKKFMAALKGIDLDKENGKSGGNAWEEMKARVFSRGKATDSNDITALQGYNATKAGFGIGMGLGYEDLTKK